MTPEEVLSHSVDQIQELFGLTRDQAFAKRKRAHNAIWQRKYRARYKATQPNPWLGYLDGPPIETCPVADALRDNAITGSARLLEALQRAAR